MDELKKLIAENRGMFDSAEPSEGHIDRFSEILNQQNNQKIKKVSFTWTTMLKVASVAILVVLSGLYVTERILELVPEASYSQTNPEFSETQQYYIQQVNLRVGEIEQMDKVMTSEQRQLLTEEMTNMDNMYKKLQNDLNAMPNDPRIMQAMLQHYQMKMDILNRIINDLENVQHLKTPDHESIEL